MLQMKMPILSVGRVWLEVEKVLYCSVCVVLVCDFCFFVLSRCFIRRNVVFK